MTKMPRSPNERRERLLYYIRSQGHCEITDLSNVFGVSEMTIRRDVAQLEEEGSVCRVYGGVEPAPFSPLVHSWEHRVMQDRAQKIALGLAAANLIVDGSVVALDGSSTAYYVARNLVDRNLTVITNGVHALMELGQRPGIELYVTGGYVRDTGDLVGSHACAFAEATNADYYIFGVSGIDPEKGLTEPSPDDIEIKRTFLRNSKHNILVATAPKFKRVLTFRLTPIDVIHTVVTDSGTPEEVINELRRRGIDVVVVEASLNDLVNSCTDDDLEANDAGAEPSDE